MPFTYTIPSADRIVFSRKVQRLGQFIFIFMGIICVIVGSMIYRNAKDPTDFVLVMQYFLIGFGAIAVYIGFRIPIIQSKTTPDQIIFDNVNGRIEISQKASDIRTAYMYFDEIEDFIVKARSKGSSDSTRASRTRYSYHVYMLKKDGAEWELIKRNSDRKAQEDVIRLRSSINFAASPQRVAVPAHATRKYAVRDEYHKTQLSWRNSLGTGPLILLAFVAGLVALVYAFSQADSEFFDDWPFFAYLVVGFMGLVFLGVIFGIVKKMIKNSRTIYAVSISNDSLDYIEKDLGERVRKTITFPLADVHSISFSFDTEHSGRNLSIYTNEQFRKKRSMTISFSVQALRELYEFKKGLVTLDFQDLTPVEALHIENFLQQKIREKGNVAVA